MAAIRGKHQRSAFLRTGLAEHYRENDRARAVLLARTSANAAALRPRRTSRCLTTTPWSRGPMQSLPACAPRAWSRRKMLPKASMARRPTAQTSCATWLPRTSSRWSRPGGRPPKRTTLSSCVPASVPNPYKISIHPLEWVNGVGHSLPLGLDRYRSFVKIHDSK